MPNVAHLKGQVDYMKNRVLYFKEKLDFLLTHINWLLYAVVILVASLLWLPFKQLVSNLSLHFQTQPSQLEQDVIAGILATILPSGMVWIVKRLKGGKALASRAKAWLYRLLSQIYYDNEGKVFAKPIPRIIHIFYRRKSFLIPSQEQVTKDLLEYIMRPDEAGPRIAWIIGPSYSGKTTTILNVLIQIITNTHYQSAFYQIDRKIKYYDLSRPNSDINYLMSLKPGELRNCLVIIDNFHSLSAENCLVCANQLSKWDSFATIVLTREPHEFLNQDMQIAKLETAIKEQGRPFNLPPLDVNSSSLKPSYYATLTTQYGFVPENENAAIIFHLAGILNWHSENKTNFTHIFSAFYNGTADNGVENQTIVAVIATSLFSGGISMSTLKGVLKGCNPMLYVRMLVNSGFLQPSPEISNEYYLFHETLARYYIQHTYQSYRKQYQAAFLALMSIDGATLHQRYLYSRLLLQISNEDTQYDVLFLNSNYKNLLNQMNFIASLEPKARYLYSREFGILYDRIGLLKSAETAYQDYLEQGSNRADAILKLVQVNHQYYQKYRDEYPVMLADPDPYIRLLAKYWKLHIEMHTGTFSFAQFSDLITEWEMYLNPILTSHPYEGMHLLRRTYFDYFRVYYMQGILDYTKLDLLRSVTLRAALLKLPEFSAYFNKFVYGHYLHYDVVFKLGIFHDPATEEELRFVFGDKQEVLFSGCDLEKIVDLALGFYAEACNFMEQVGDKTAYFVRCRYMEIEAARGKYEQANTFYQNFYAFAKKEQSDYYKGCAELYISKLLLIKRFDPREVPSMDTSALYNEIMNRLDNAWRYFHSADHVNPYAETYIILYRTLLQFITDGAESPKQARKRLRDGSAALVALAQKNNYLRLKKILGLIDEEHLSFATAGNIIKYFPFVAQ